VLVEVSCVEAIATSNFENGVGAKVVMREDRLARSPAGQPHRHSGEVEATTTSNRGCIKVRSCRVVGIWLAIMVITGQEILRTN